MTYYLMQVAPLFEGLRKQFNRPTNEFGTWGGLILLVGGALILAVMMHALFYYEKRSAAGFSTHNPSKLFSELAKLLPLSRSQLRILHRVAHELKMKHPAQLLLSPGVFSSSVHQWIEDNPQHQSLLGNIEQIKLLLFGPVTPSVSQTSSGE